MNLSIEQIQNLRKDNWQAFSEFNSDSITQPIIVFRGYESELLPFTIFDIAYILSKEPYNKPNIFNLFCQILRNAGKPIPQFTNKEITLDVAIIIDDTNQIETLKNGTLLDSFYKILYYQAPNVLSLLIRKYENATITFTNTLRAFLNKESNKTALRFLFSALCIPSSKHFEYYQTLLSKTDEKFARAFISQMIKLFEEDELYPSVIENYLQSVPQPQLPFIYVLMIKDKIKNRETHAKAMHCIKTSLKKVCDNIKGDEPLGDSICQNFNSLRNKVGTTHSMEIKAYINLFKDRVAIHELFISTIGSRFWLGASLITAVAKNEIISFRSGSDDSNVLHLILNHSPTVFDGSLFISLFTPLLDLLFTKNRYGYTPLDILFLRLGDDNISGFISKINDHIFNLGQKNNQLQIFIEQQNNNSLGENEFKQTIIPSLIILLLGLQTHRKEMILISEATIHLYLLFLKTIFGFNDSFNYYDAAIKQLKLVEETILKNSSSSALILFNMREKAAAATVTISKDKLQALLNTILAAKDKNKVIKFPESVRPNPTPTVTKRAQALIPSIQTKMTQNQLPMEYVNAKINNLSEDDFKQLTQPLNKVFGREFNRNEFKQWFKFDKNLFLLAELNAYDPEDILNSISAIELTQEDVDFVNKNLTFTIRDTRKQGVYYHPHDNGLPVGPGGAKIRYKHHFQFSFLEFYFFLKHQQIFHKFSTPNDPASGKPNGLFLKTIMQSISSGIGVQFEHKIMLTSFKDLLFIPRVIEIFKSIDFNAQSFDYKLNAYANTFKENLSTAYLAYLKDIGIFDRLNEEYQYTSRDSLLHYRDNHFDMSTHDDVTYWRAKKSSSTSPNYALFNLLILTYIFRKFKLIGKDPAVIQFTDIVNKTEVAPEVINDINLFSHNKQAFSDLLHAAFFGNESVEDFLQEHANDILNNSNQPFICFPEGRFTFPTTEKGIVLECLQAIESYCQKNVKVDAMEIEEPTTTTINDDTDFSSWSLTQLLKKAFRLNALIPLRVFYEKNQQSDNKMVTKEFGSLEKGHVRPMTLVAKPFKISLYNQHVPEVSMSGFAFTPIYKILPAYAFVWFDDNAYSNLLQKINKDGKLSHQEMAEQVALSSCLRPYYDAMDIYNKLEHRMLKQRGEFPKISINNFLENFYYWCVTTYTQKVSLKYLRDYCQSIPAKLTNHLKTIFDRLTQSTLYPIENFFEALQQRRNKHSGLHQKALYQKSNEKDGAQRHNELLAQGIEYIPTVKEQSQNSLDLNPSDYLSNILKVIRERCAELTGPLIQLSDHGLSMTHQSWLTLLETRPKQNTSFALFNNSNKKNIVTYIEPEFMEALFAFNDLPVPRTQVQNADNLVNENSTPQIVEIVPPAPASFNISTFFNNPTPPSVQQIGEEKQDKLIIKFPRKVVEEALKQSQTAAAAVSQKLIGFHKEAFLSFLSQKANLKRKNPDEKINEDPKSKKARFEEKDSDSSAELKR